MSSWRPFRRAALGALDPFMLVLEGSVPNEQINGDGHWCGLRHRPGHRPADPRLHVDRSPRPASRRSAGARNLRRLRRHPGDARQPHRRDGPARLPRPRTGPRGSGLPIVNLPGCPVQPDNITETLLHLALHVAGVERGARARRAGPAAVAVRAHGAGGLRPRGLRRAGRVRADPGRPPGLPGEARLQGAGREVQRSGPRLDRRASAAARTWAGSAWPARCPGSRIGSCRSWSRAAGGARAARGAGSPTGRSCRRLRGRAIRRRFDVEPDWRPPGADAALAATSRAGEAGVPTPLIFRCDFCDARARSRDPAHARARIARAGLRCRTSRCRRAAGWPGSGGGPLGPRRYACARAPRRADRLPARALRDDRPSPMEAAALPDERPLRRHRAGDSPRRAVADAEVGRVVNAAGRRSAGPSTPPTATSRSASSRWPTSRPARTSSGPRPGGGRSTRVAVGRARLVRARPGDAQRRCGDGRGPGPRRRARVRPTAVGDTARRQPAGLAGAGADRGWGLRTSLTPRVPFAQVYGDSVTWVTESPFGQIASLTDIPASSSAQFSESWPNTIRAPVSLASSCSRL